MSHSRQNSKTSEQTSIVTMSAIREDIPKTDYQFYKLLLNTVPKFEKCLQICGEHHVTVTQMSTKKNCRKIKKLYDFAE